MTFKLVRVFIFSPQLAKINIDVDFVENDYDSTGLGEPLFPPIFGALANARYKANGARIYDQPFYRESGVLG